MLLLAHRLRPGQCRMALVQRFPLAVALGYMFGYDSGGQIGTGLRRREQRSEAGLHVMPGVARRVRSSSWRTLLSRRVLHLSSGHSIITTFQFISRNSL